MITTSGDTRKPRKLSPLWVSLIGLLIGLFVGITTYLATSWVFYSNDSETNLISPKFASNSSNTISTTAELTKNDWIFSGDWRYSDLQKISAFLSTLKQQDLQSLIQKSSAQPITDRLYTVQEMLFESLVQMSPTNAVFSVEEFTGHRRQELIRSIFSQWSLLNLESALVATTELPRTERNIALDAILTLRTDLQKETVSSIAKGHDFESDLKMWEQENTLYTLLDRAPSNAISVLVNDGVDDVQQFDLYVEVLEKWFQNDGLSVLTKLHDLRPGEELFADLFDYLTGKDRVAALNFIVDLSSNTRNSFGFRLLSNWINEDGREAFEAISELPKSRFRNTMMNTLVREWGRNDPNTIVDLLTDIPRSNRADALAVAARTLALDSPAVALARISSLPSVPGANKDLALRSVLGIWSAEAPMLALGWIQDNMEGGSKRRAELISQVLWSYARVDPENAMKIAVEEFHPDNQSYDLQSRVISSLVSSNRIDTAIELVEQVRVEERVRSSVLIGVALAKRRDIDRVVTLSEQLPEEHRFGYFNMVSINLLRDHTSDFLDLMAKIPSTSLRSDLAKRILNGAAKQRFTAQQIETLRSQVSD